MDSAEAHILWAGLVARRAALYEVKFEIPEHVEAGRREIKVEAAGRPSQEGMFLILGGEVP